MRVYYNEFDPFAAAWLAELMREGVIPAGDIDTRSIIDVKPDDVRGYTQAHFFAGIGGWAYALSLAGWGGRSVWTGSCPCQPFSAAGKRRGNADERHLWPVWFRLLAECRPDVVFGEQVEAAIRMGWLDGVRADLEGEDYALGAAVLGAHSVGAPHIRQRLFWLGESDSGRRSARKSTGAALGQGCAAESTSRIGGLADADGRRAGHGHLQSGGQHGQQPQDGGAGGRLDDAAGDGRREVGRHVDSAPGRGEGPRHAAGSGEGGLGDARGQGLALGSIAADGRRTVRREGPPAAADGVHGFWSRAEWLACSDGKTRRVEPDIFPLAYGVPNRVGTLRGAGNAIVPALAAQFIGAYLDISN